MICIDGHTFDETLLIDGWIIDAGCRGMNFSNYFLEYASPKKVLAIDIEDFKLNDESEFHKFKFKQAALTNKSGQVDAYFFGNGTGNFIRPINEAPGNTEDRPCEMKTVPAITLQDIYKEIGTNIDLLKLDIEGAEYLVLQDFEPIPKQITVETHQHCHPHLHEMYWEDIFENLCKHYNASLYIRDWPKYKFMDCLFIRKDLI